MSITYLNLAGKLTSNDNFMFKMAFDTSYHSQNLMYSTLAKGKICDPPLAFVLTHFLTAGDTFIDVGSHIGYYSLLALQKVGPNGRILAFEPNPETFSVLTLNAMINDAGNFHAFNCALSDKPGTSTLYVNNFDEGLSSLCNTSNDSEGEPYYDKVKPLAVMSLTLDQIADFAKCTKIKMIKIDVEGYEQKVLNGGGNFIRDFSPPYIVFEINNSIPNQETGQDYEIRERFSELDYHAYLVRPWPNSARIQEIFGKDTLIHLPKETVLELEYGNILLSKEKLE